MTQYIDIFWPSNDAYSNDLFLRIPNLSCSEDGMFHKRQVNRMAADVLATCVARSSAAMIYQLDFIAWNVDDDDDTYIYIQYICEYELIYVICKSCYILH